MHKRIIWAIVVYCVGVLFTLLIFYILLTNESSREEGVFFPFVAALLFATGWIYVTTTHMLSSQTALRRRLYRLTEEIVHELQLPLATIRANTSMLRKGCDTPKIRRRIERVEEATDRLETLYRELTYLLTKEIKPVEKHCFDVSEVIRKRVAFFSHEGRNPIETRLEPFIVEADRIGFEKAFDNVLSNAVKYSEKGMPIEIVSEKGRIEIRDRGIGMDETEMVRIFERYYRGVEDNKGKGLGLAIVKAYCDEAGIEIRLHSVKGEGTTVSLDMSHLAADKDGCDATAS